MGYEIGSGVMLGIPGQSYESLAANILLFRELGLNRGANVVMPNLTPSQYRAKYEIYPNKACIYESPEDCHQCVSMRIELLGRTIGKGTGSRKKLN